MKVKQFILWTLEKKSLKTYLECLAVISDIFSGGAVFVPHQMIAVEKLCFGTSNKSEIEQRRTYNWTISHLMIVMPLYYTYYMLCMLCLSNRTGLSCQRRVSMRLPNVNDNLCCYIYSIFNYSFDHRGRLEFNFSKDNP